MIKYSSPSKAAWCKFTKATGIPNDGKNHHDEINEKLEKYHALIIHEGIFFASEEDLVLFTLEWS